jgi:VanZ family protein
MVKRWWAVLLALWIGGILFPFESLRQFSASYRRAFDFVFGHESAHIVMHGFLFAVLAGGLRRRLGVRPAILVALVVGCLQEMIQALTGRGYDVRDGLFDVVVDVTGAGIGVTAVWLWSRLWS